VHGEREREESGILGLVGWRGERRGAKKEGGMGEDGGEGEF